MHYQFGIFIRKRFEMKSVGFAIVKWSVNAFGQQNYVDLKHLMFESYIENYVWLLRESIYGYLAAWCKIFQVKIYKFISSELNSVIHIF